MHLGRAAEMLNGPVKHVERKKIAHQIDNLAEVDFNAAFIQVWIARRIVDKLGELALPHLRRAVTEHE